MRKLLFMLKGIFFTGLALVWLVLISLILVWIMFYKKTWVPMNESHHKYDHEHFMTHGKY